MTADKRQAETNGSNFHWRTVDLMIRILMPIVVLMLGIVTGVVIDNQSKLAGIDERVRFLESRTSLMPPADYRTYMDIRFQTVLDQIAALRSDLEKHRDAAER